MTKAQRLAAERRSPLKPRGRLPEPEGAVKKPKRKCLRCGEIFQPPAEPVRHLCNACFAYNTRNDDGAADPLRLARSRR